MVGVQRLSAHDDLIDDGAVPRFKTLRRIGQGAFGEVRGQGGMGLEWVMKKAMGLGRDGYEFVHVGKEHKRIEWKIDLGGTWCGMPKIAVNQLVSLWDLISKCSPYSCRQ